MLKKVIAVMIQFIYAFSLVGCGPELELGYQPPIPIPVRVSINTRGEIKVGLSGDIITPIGKFDIGGNVNINSIRTEYINKILVVQVDDSVVVYELENGKEFKINFDDNNSLYKKVALLYESNGDIVLELESLQKVDESTQYPPKENWSGKLTVRETTLNELRADNPPSIWIVNNIELYDLASPEMLPFLGYVNAKDEYLFPVYWCATSAELLIQNMDNIETTLTINGEVIPDKLVSKYNYDPNDTWKCKYHSVVLSGWQMGEQYIFQAKRDFKATVFDGETNYRPGIYIYQITLDVK